MLSELSKTYEPASIQGPITKKWLDHKAFAAHPDARAERYVIMPLPNVTGNAADPAAFDARLKGR